MMMMWNRPFMYLLMAVTFRGGLSIGIEKIGSGNKASLPVNSEHLLHDSVSRSEVGQRVESGVGYDDDLIDIDGSDGDDASVLPETKQEGNKNGLVTAGTRNTSLEDDEDLLEQLVSGSGSGTGILDIERLFHQMPTELTTKRSSQLYTIQDKSTPEISVSERKSGMQKLELKENIEINMESGIEANSYSNITENNGESSINITRVIDDHDNDDSFVESDENVEKDGKDGSSIVVERPGGVFIKNNSELDGSEYMKGVEVDRNINGEVSGAFVSTTAHVISGNWEKVSTSAMTVSPNKSGVFDNVTIGTSEKSVSSDDKSILTKPGPLAGIIGGIVFLLVVIMFVVYSIRKTRWQHVPDQEPRAPEPENECLA